MSKTLSSPPYGNCKVLDGDGELMFRCDDRKTNWYLQRGLARIVSENPCTIQLMFEPKGRGHIGDNFFLQEKMNKCVVCGSHDHLTKHHVVPRVYRKFFSEELKSHSSYDVVVLCIKCHEAYEEHAFNLKKIIGDEFGIPVHGTGGIRDERLCRVRMAANALINHRHRMPHARIEELLDRLREHYGKHDITDEDLETANTVDFLSLEGYVYHGKYVVEHLDDLEAFIKKWRKHFIDTMLPQHLPDGWNQERPIQRDLIVPREGTNG